jgi:carboxyl-terminal processing protease
VNTLTLRIFTLILMSACAVAIACTPADKGSPRGDPAASDKTGRAASNQQPTNRAPNPAQGTGQARILDSSDMGLVYALLFQEYVDAVDGPTLINAATQSIHELMMSSGFLPMDFGVLDLFPLANDGDPATAWTNFSMGYDALVDKHGAWARGARPDQVAIRGMLASLNDNHTMFIDPEERRRMNQSSYVGIGVRLTKSEENQPPVIVEVFPRSPASQAGLKAGDRIETADNIDASNIPLSEIVKVIRGNAGTSVHISFSRQARSQRLEVDVNRAAVEPRRVEGGPLGSGVGYVRIRSFGADVPNQVFDQLNAITRARANGVQGLVLDLRGNTGGELRAVANVGGAFFPGKPLGLSMDRTGEQQPIIAEGKKLVGDDPVVVLTDRDTGSGAEILAAALREHGIASIIGTNSAGSVGIASISELPDGSAVQITERRLVTPQGVRLDRVGIKPDIDVPTTVADLEAGKDPPLERAIQMIKERTGR